MSPQNFTVLLFVWLFLSGFSFVANSWLIYKNPTRATSLHMVGYYANVVSLLCVLALVVLNFIQPIGN